MAENPLLPDDELRRLYRLLQHAGRGPRLTAPAGTSVALAGGMEALTASCTMQLQGADTLVFSSTLKAPQGVGKIWFEHALTVSTVPQGVSSLLAAASVASAQQARSDGSLALTFLDAGHPDNAWQAALQWAQEQSLPLIVALVDRSGQESMQRSPKRASVPGWTAVERLCRQLQLPVLTVDGQDAIASYRVMQEAALRARAGGGPAILWAVLPRLDQQAETTPLTHLTRYMKVRRIALR